jgi:hypothetical protein
MGDFPQCSLTSNYSADGSIQVQSTAFEQSENVRLALPEAAHIYDIRGGKYLGHKAVILFELDPWRPTMLTVNPRKFGELSFRASSRRVTPGREVTLDITLTWEFPVANKPVEVVQVSVMRPDGQPAKHYEANLKFKGQKTSRVIPFAVNDPKGKLTVAVNHRSSVQKSIVTIELMN